MNSEIKETESKCSACGCTSGPGEFWSEKYFCESCLSDANLTGRSVSDLDETHSFSLIQSWLVGFSSALLTSTMLAALIVGIFALLSVAFTVEKLWIGQIGIVDLSRLWVPIGMFFGFSWCFVALISFPLAFLVTMLPPLTRIYVEDDQLVVETRFSRSKAPLNECSWRFTHLGTDGLVYLYSRVPKIQLICGEKRQYLVGWSEDQIQLWGQFLRIYDVHYVLRPSLVQSFRTISSKLVIGGLVGLLFGVLIAIGSGNSRWITSCIFAGFLDGFAMALVELFLYTDRAEKIQEKLSPLNAGMTFGLLGVKSGAYIGLVGFAVCGLVNGLVGWVIGKELEKKIHQGAIGYHASETAKNVTTESRQSDETIEN